MITGHYAAADVLLRHGANINLRNAGGLTPLHDLVRAPDEAERYEHFLPQARFLLYRGADLNALSAQGETALDMAIRLENETLATFLRKRGGKRAQE